jgi:DNA-binding GntR family transcriptional regulator
MKRSQSLSTQVYNVIKKDILTCVLDPGSKIAQPELVSQYGFGVTPTREALKRLEHEGYLQSIPRFGYLISPITERDMREVYDFRMILEKPAAQMAIKFASDEQLSKILEQANFTYTYHDRETYLKFLNHNIDFHRAIALASGNRRLADTLTMVLNELTRPFSLGLDLRDSAEEMRREHIELATALMDRDAERTDRILDEQITRSRERIFEMLIRRHSQLPTQETIF